jgi:hypothetical protein
MTTKIDVFINDLRTGLLDSAKQTQEAQRAKDIQARENNKVKLDANKVLKDKEELEDDKWKGAVSDPEEKKKRENRAKKRKCGFWVFRDYVIGTPNYPGGPRVPEQRTDLDSDSMQISVGTSDGTTWATHVFQGPGGKPAEGPEITGSQTFIGYLSYVQYYEGGSAFGTVYTIPEGATVVPYDPMVYLQSSSSNWGLYFPDELNSGEAKYRKMVTLNRRTYSSTAVYANQNAFYFPVNNKTTVAIFPNWLGWYNGVGTESYWGEAPEEYFLHPQDTTRPSIRRTVYYKYPGGSETGWQPIYGYYWLMDPADETSAMNLQRLGQLFPLNTVTTFTHAGSDEIELVGFVIGSSNVKKLDSIPPDVEAKIKARCPAPFWDTSNSYYNKWNWLDVIDKTPGYPSDIDDDYNIESWMFNPQALAMGIAINLFYRWNPDWSTYLPYDYWFRDGEFSVIYPERGSLLFPLIMGASPGIYDAYNLDLQDHFFYNHFGKGEWYNEWMGYTYSTKDSWISEYGNVAIHTGDIREEAWKWMYEINNTDAPGSNPASHITSNDIAWLYLNPTDRQAFIQNYRGGNYNGYSANFTQAEYTYLLSAPADPIFTYIYYERNLQKGKLADGVRWISDGYEGAWTDSNSPAFDYGLDPFYDTPYMDIEDEHWVKYRLKTKLSPTRSWPPSISAGFFDPVPWDTPSSAKAGHPLARGGRNLTYVINTAWGNDYSQVLLQMGFTGQDLAI